MTHAAIGHHELTEEILGSLARRHSTATVLFHHAIAERLGLGPSDHKCLDLLLDRGPMTGSELAAITGLTTGAVTGVVARLERAGHLRRERHPSDARKQTLHPSTEANHDVQELFDAIRDDASALLAGFEPHQLAAIAEFLTRTTDFAYRRTALLRAEARSRGGSAPPAATTSEPGPERS
jgi:DNA-binding MarR family transcriptional regulator